MVREEEQPIVLSPEEATHVATVVDVCLDRGFDVEGVDREILERARDRLHDHADE